MLNEPLQTVCMSLGVCADPVEYLLLFLAVDVLLNPCKTLLCLSLSDVCNKSFQHGNIGREPRLKMGHIAGIKHETFPDPFNAMFFAGGAVGTQTLVF